MPKTVLSLLLALALAACAAPLPSTAPAATLTPQPSAAPAQAQTAPLLPSPSVTSIPAAIPFNTRSLREMAEAHNLLFGAAVAAQPLREDEAYRELLGREFNLVVAENAMKWDATEPQRGQFNFTDGDAIVDFAVEHNMRVRGHCLVWHQALPDWVKQGDWSKEELAQILRDHIQGVVSHYKGKVYAWDVVNEAVDENGGLSANFWYKALGEEYIEIAFQAAHEADPDALLFYNDYGAEFISPKADAVYELVKGLRERGVPVHGVGLQMHLALGDFIDQLSLEMNIQRLSDLGLLVHVTELDVRVPDGYDANHLDLQAAAYGDILRACVGQDACQAVLIWGVTDRYSWVPTQYKGQGAALPFDEQYRPKPAYLAWVKVLTSP